MLAAKPCSVSPPQAEHRRFRGSWQWTEFQCWRWREAFHVAQPRSLARIEGRSKFYRHLRSRVASRAYLPILL